MVDLGKPQTLDQVVISWENGYASEYALQGSLDGETFTDLTVIKDGQGGRVSHDVSGSDAVRYLRVYCTKAYNAAWGYSIYELEAYASRENTILSLCSGIAAMLDGVAPGSGNGQIDEAELAKVSTLLEQARAAAENGLDETSFSQWYVRLESVLETLPDKIHTDKTALQALFDQLSTLNPAQFTQESYAAFQQAVSGITQQTIEEASTWKEIAALQQTLEQAQSLLVRKGMWQLLSITTAYADAIDLNQIEHLNTLVRNAFEQALEQAHALLADPAAPDAELTDGWKVLSQAIHMLSFTSDKSELAALLEEARQSDLTLVPQSVRQQLEQAVEQAQRVLDDPAALDEVSIAKAIADLKEALALLRQSQTLDLSLLQMLFDAVKDTDLQRYTPASGTLFEAALQQAASVLASPENQEQIDAACSSLHEAWLNLRLIPDESLLASLKALQQTLAQMESNPAYARHAEALKTMNARLQQALNDPNLEAGAAQALHDEAKALIEGLNHANRSAASVKTGTASHTASWMMAGLASLAVLLKNRKRKE